MDLAALMVAVTPDLRDLKVSKGQRVTRVLLGHVPADLQVLWVARETLGLPDLTVLRVMLVLWADRVDLAIRVTQAIEARLVLWVALVSVVAWAIPATRDLKVILVPRGLSAPRVMLAFVDQEDKLVRTAVKDTRANLDHAERPVSLAVVVRRATQVKLVLLAQLVTKERRGHVVSVAHQASTALRVILASVVAVATKDLLVPSEPLAKRA